MTASEMPTSLSGGRYLLVKPLGEGGMASVFRAYDQRLQVWRAIKILAPALAKKAKLRQRFEAEAQTMAILEHRNIVRVYDVGNDGDLAYIVMEVVEGGCLVDWLEDHGPMPARLAVETMLQVCEGIAYAHKKGVIHRDIKPHNVLVTTEGVCRVTDFGIARMEDNSNMTKTGAVMGTWGYMAPEQRSDAKHVDVRADEYALGATLYSLITNKTPMDLFAADRDASMMEGVPEQLLDVLIKSTEYRKEDRFPDVEAFAAALRALLLVLPPDPAGTPPIARPAGPPLPVPNAADFVKITQQAGANRETSVPPPASVDNLTMIPDAGGSPMAAAGPTAVPSGSGNPAGNPGVNPHAGALTYGPDMGADPFSGAAAPAGQGRTYVPGYTQADAPGMMSIPPGYSASPQPEARGGAAMWVVAAGLGFVGLSVLILVAVIAYTQTRPGAVSEPTGPTVADARPVVEPPPVEASPAGDRSPVPPPVEAPANPVPPVAPPVEVKAPVETPRGTKTKTKVEPPPVAVVAPELVKVEVPTPVAATVNADCMKVDPVASVVPGVPVVFRVTFCDQRKGASVRVWFRPPGGSWTSTDMRPFASPGTYIHRMEPDDSYRAGMDWYVVGPDGWTSGTQNNPKQVR